MFHPNKPGKVRRVLNGGVKFHGVSLNSKLLTGPDLMQTLIHVFMRFRQHPYAVSADIEGIFLQDGVIPEDRPSLRFLWQEDPATDIAVYQYIRHISGSKDSPTSANYAWQQSALLDNWRLSGQQRDNNLPDNVCKKFLEWAEELPNLSAKTIPRCYVRGTMERVELDVSGDSSQDVFSAVAFLRARVSLNERTKTQVAFVFGKARVAPMKALTILKLELQAALLAARLKDEIQQALTVPVERTFMWIDGTTDLQWLYSIDKKPVFVANRVAEILELTTVDEWNHVPTANNQAEAGTCGLSANALLDSPWLKGPKFS